jgi:iron complex transport system substrate-binding protein
MSPDMHRIPIMLTALALSARLSAQATPLTIVDATGEAIVFAETPRRIVSLNPDFTENLFALGAGDRIVGVTTFCDHPPEAGLKERVGDLWTPSIEKILSLSPDLILATQEGNRPQTVKALRDLKLKVFVSSAAQSIDGYIENLLQLSRIIGAEAQGEELAAGLRAEIGRAQERASGRPRPQVFFQLGRSPIVTVARGTIIGELIEIAGGENIAAGAPLRYPTFSREKVLADDPEIIIIALEEGEAEVARDEWRKFGSLSAVKNGRVYILDPDLVSRAGPRLAEGLKKVGEIVRSVKSEQ